MCLRQDHYAYFPGIFSNAIPNVASIPVVFEDTPFTEPTALVSQLPQIHVVEDPLLQKRNSWAISILNMSTQQQPGAHLFDKAIFDTEANQTSNVLKTIKIEYRHKLSSPLAIKLNITFDALPPVIANVRFLPTVFADYVPCNAHVQSAVNQSYTFRCIKPDPFSEQEVFDLTVEADHPAGMMSSCQVLSYDTECTITFLKPFSEASVPIYMHETFSNEIILFGTFNATVHECSKQSCSNHGSCDFQGDPFDARFICICDDGYSGLRCEEAVPQVSTLRKDSGQRAGTIAGASIGSLVALSVLVFWAWKRYTAPKKRFHVFISYRVQEHEALAAELYTHLKQQFLTSGHQVQVFRDADELKSGLGWEEQFTAALQESCVVLSTNQFCKVWWPMLNKANKTTCSRRLSLHKICASLILVPFSPLCCPMKANRGLWSHLTRLCLDLRLILQ